MKTISRLRYFIYLSILFVGCSTGKNALQKGNYDTSVEKAVSRLQSAPQNREAQQVLVSAYQLSLNTHLRKIEEAGQSADALRWETVIREYEQLNYLADEISRCPSCLTVIPDVQRFTTELSESRRNAAAARYSLGIKLLNDGDKLSARKAYQYFEKAQYLYPDYKDTRRKMNEAYQAALIRVVVEPAVVNSKYYELSNQYFQQKVSEWMSAYQQNKFVRFYDQQQAQQQRIVPDQVLRMQFDDFMVGQTYVKEKVEKLEKDSVKIGETRADGPIYGKVKATLSVFNKQITSSGLLDMRLTDWNTGKVIRQKKIAGTYVWEDQWASYNGDERALTKEQLALTKKKEIVPPAPAALFVEFTKPIYSQLIQELSSFYSKY